MRDTNLKSGTYTFSEPPNEMQLESGRTFGPITLHYETYGHLNEAKSNVIYVCHALTGNAHLMKEVSAKYGVRVYAFCLMPNHVHLLFSLREDNLFDAMRDLFSRYALWFNRKYERKGHLFGGPYRQSVCLDDGYLLVASIYIHINPVRAKLVPEAALYRWSTARLYLDENAPESFVQYADYVSSIDTVKHPFDDGVSARKGIEW